MELDKQFSDKALQDFKLIDLARDHGDEKAYAELMKRYKKPLYHTILKMVRNVDDAEDLMIEAFAKAFKSLHKFKKRLYVQYLAFPDCYQQLHRLYSEEKARNDQHQFFFQRRQRG